MTLERAIELLGNVHWPTDEMEEAQSLAVDCIKFTIDFLSLNATTEKMKHAINLLNALEYIMKR